MNAFIDEHQGGQTVKPICRVMQIARVYEVRKVWRQLNREEFDGTLHRGAP